METMSTSSVKRLSFKNHFYFSFQAGLCACGGSVFGKLSSAQFSSIENSVVQYAVSAIFIALMFLCNAAIWTFFVKALQATNSSFIPTLTIAAINYITSAVVGLLLFGESLSLIWCIGTLLIFAGLALLASDPSHSFQDKIK